MNPSEKLSSDLSGLISIFKSRMDSYEDRLKTVTKPASSTAPDVTQLIREFADFKTFVWDSLSTLKAQIDLLSLGLDRHETFLRRKVLLLHGIPESKDEKAFIVVSKVMSEQMKLTEVTSSDLEVCHRLGSNPAKPRPILIRFRDYQQRQAVWDNKTTLKGSGFTLSEFLTRPRHLVFVEARKHFGVNRCWSADGKINVVLPDQTRRRFESMVELDELKHLYPPVADSVPPKPQAEVKIPVVTAPKTIRAARKK